MQCNGNQVADLHVLCTGDDLDGLFGTDVHLADHQLVGVGVLLDGEDFADDHVGDALVHATEALDLRARHVQLVGDGLIRRIQRNVFF